MSAGWPAVGRGAASEQQAGLDPVTLADFLPDRLKLAEHKAKNLAGKSKEEASVNKINASCACSNALCTNNSSVSGPKYSTVFYNSSPGSSNHECDVQEFPTLEEATGRLKSKRQAQRHRNRQACFEALIEADFKDEVQDESDYENYVAQ